MKWFIVAIAAMGAVRFTLNLAGVPDDIVKYFSMTAIVSAGAVYFAVTSPTHKERLKDAFLLILPYMAVEALALGYTWASGRRTIFHTEEYSLGFPIAQHTIGHIVGGLTWEPLSVFLVMEVVWAIQMGGRMVFKPRRTIAGLLAASVLFLNSSECSTSCRFVEGPRPPVAISN